MSSPAPRRSADNHGSPISSPSSSQYPFPQIDISQRPRSSGRYNRRRGSTSSSITSIGGILDTATTGADSIAEASNNGLCSRFMLGSHTKLDRSHCNTFTAANCPHRPCAICCCSQLPEAALFERYSSCHFDQHPSHRTIRILAIPEASRLPVRCVSTRQGERGN